MNRERWAIVRAVFLRVAGAPEESRAGLLDDACAGDAELRAEVLKLLRADATPSAFDSDPAAQIGLPESERATAIEECEMALPLRIGGYEVERVLGEGGFGVVYLAEQASTRRRVALKTIRPILTTGDAARRLQREARVLARLDHVGIARVYEAGMARDPAGAGVPFFAMEWVEGANLLVHAERAGLSVSDRLRLFLSVCDAVAHAHQHGVLHRDLKPSNVLVGRDGQPKVLDFGVAYILHPDSATLMTLQHSGLLGTLAYMSPEHAADDPGPPDTRSDVYSLGAILYELLARRPVFDFADTPIHVALRRIHESEPALLGRVDPALRGDLEAIAAKALAKNRVHRYQSVSEYAADVRRWLGSEPVLARRIGAARRVRLWARRRKRLAVGLAAALVVTAVGGAWLVETETRLRREHEAARDALEGLLGGVVKELAPMAGTVSRREQVLVWAESQVTRMRSGRERDGRLAEMHATVLCELGGVALERLDQAEALRLRSRALEIREAIQPKSPETWAALSFNLALVADSTRDAGDVETARMMYARALEIDERLVENHPENPWFLDNLTWSYERLADGLGQRGDLEEMERVALRRRELAHRLVSLDGERTLSYHALWASRAGLSFAYAMQGRRDEAEAQHIGMLADAETLIAREPNNRRYRTNLVFTMLQNSVNMRADGRPQDAIVLLDRVVAMTITLAETHGTDASTLENLARALFQRASAHEQLGQLEPASADIEALMRVSEQMRVIAGSSIANEHQTRAQEVLQRIDGRRAGAGVAG